MFSITVFFSALLIFSTNIVVADPLIPNQHQEKILARKFGNKAASRVRAWRALINNNHQRTVQEKLVIVNSFFNRQRFVSDRKHWGKEDYWATPLELLITNAGDSEDFAIAKYFTLRALGISADNMRIIYVRSIRFKRLTMVVAYYPKPDSSPFILGYFDKQVKHASDRKDLSAVFSFNGDYLWIAKEKKGRDNLVGSSTRVEKWAILRKRMKKEKRKYVTRP